MSQKKQGTKEQTSGDRGKAAAATPHLKMSDADVQRVIRMKGLWPTRRRVLIFKAMYAAASPLPVEALAQKVKGKADRVTVYRTLQVFGEKGIAARVNVRSDREYYELAPLGDTHHHHLVCDGCGIVEDVEVPEPKNLEKNILAQSKRFGSITSHSLEFFGKCRMCVKV